MRCTGLSFSRHGPLLGRGQSGKPNLHRLLVRRHDAERQSFCCTFVPQRLLCEPSYRAGSHVLSPNSDRCLRALEMHPMPAWHDICRRPLSVQAERWVCLPDGRLRAGDSWKCHSVRGLPQGPVPQGLWIDDLKQPADVHNLPAGLLQQPHGLYVQVLPPIWRELLDGDGRCRSFL